MPGWHEATAELRDDGQLETIGVIQEQHPARARLFMQWKEMGWPVLVDSYGLLEVPYVPITVAVDEHGVVRRVQPNLTDEGRLPEDFVEGFVERDFPAPDDLPRSWGAPDPERLREVAEREGSVAAWRRYGDAAALWGGADGLAEALAAYGRAVEIDGEDRWARFRRGVAYRKRHDSPDREDGDFQRAVNAWDRALELAPNQYIYRRRIQQYGPRLDKPYPFYDWVETAREEIRARGEEPVALSVEPRGSEIAEPADGAPAAGRDGARPASARGDEPGAAPSEPDPGGQILRDDGEFVRMRTTVVPPAVEPGGMARVHLDLRPVSSRESHWNNEAGPLLVWVEPPDGWTARKRSLTYAPPRDTAVSGETRHLEVEVRAPSGAEAGPRDVTGYALYYVCEDVNGICMFRRQDFTAAVRVEGD